MAQKKDSASQDEAQVQDDRQDPREVKGGGVNDERVVATTQVTVEPVAQADESSYPNAADAKLDDQPLRSTQSPDDNLAAALTEGAGKHVPPDPALYDVDGRPKQ